MEHHEIAAAIAIPSLMLWALVFNFGGQVLQAARRRWDSEQRGFSYLLGRWLGRVWGSIR